MADDEVVNDDGGAAQRERLRGAGVLVAADAALRPTTTLMHEVDDENVAIASLLIDTTFSDQIGRVISWLRSTADLLESIRELES